MSTSHQPQPILLRLTQLDGSLPHTRKPSTAHPQSEEHRSLLAYLMLTGLERPADVARFTAEDVRASGAGSVFSCCGGS